MVAKREGVTWRRGRAGEYDIREWMKGRGWFVMPAADTQTGIAPMLEGLAFRAVLPDLLAALGGHSRWVDVKTKGDASWYGKGRLYNHGIQTRHWADYRACEEQTGIPGWLCVYELRPARLALLQSLEELARVARFYDGPNMPDGQPHVYFPRDVFEWYAGPDEQVARAQPGIPEAPRTLVQKPPPTVRQLSIFPRVGERQSW